MPLDPMCDETVYPYSKPLCTVKTYDDRVIEISLEIPRRPVYLNPVVAVSREGEEMSSVGVLICGYDQEDARTIKAFLDKTLDTYVFIVSASRKTDMKIIDILEKGPEECFEDEKTKILMFLGFSEVQTHMVLEGFPDSGGLKRPIFCALTGQNRHWPLRELVEHLQAEHRQWTGKGG